MAIVKRNVPRTRYGYDFVFTYDGGEYIDVYFAGSEYAHDNINVWDNDKNESTVQTGTQLGYAITDYLDDLTVETIKDQILQMKGHSK